MAKENKVFGDIMFLAADAAASAASATSATSAVILLVNAITRTNINIFFSYLLEWKIPLHGRTLLL